MNKYDIVIVGGGTSGVSCAWNAGRLGFKTLLIEKNSFLGGSITSSLVIPAMKTSDNSINNDFFYELYKNLKEINGAITYEDGNKGWINPELTKIVLDKMLIEVGVDLRFESSVNSIERNEKLSSYIVSIDNDNIFQKTGGLLEHIEAKYLVDSTGDAKICEKLNAKFLNNFSKKSQPISLRFIMSGINLEKFSNWIINYDKDRNVTTSCVVDNELHLSTACTWDSSTKWALTPIFKQAIANGDLEEEDANYFQVFTIAGAINSIAFNAPRLLKEYKNTSNAYVDGRSSILRISNFCKKYLPGFEKAYISSIANTLGIRVSNLIEGKYIYTYQDLFSGKKFDNPVVISNYPVDIHSKDKDNSKLEKVNIEYQLPVESLIAKDFDNLFVIGRCISAEFEAQAALRIIPSCFSMGEGLVKYIAKINQ